MNAGEATLKSGYVDSNLVGWRGQGRFEPKCVAIQLRFTEGWFANLQGDPANGGFRYPLRRVECIVATARSHRSFPSTRACSRLVSLAQYD